MRSFSLEPVVEMGILGPPSSPALVPPPPVEPPCLTGREDGVGPAGSGDHHGCSQLTRLGRGRS